MGNGRNCKKTFETLWLSTRIKKIIFCFEINLRKSKGYVREKSEREKVSGVRGLKERERECVCVSV